MPTASVAVRSYFVQASVYSFKFAVISFFDTHRRHAGLLPELSPGCADLDRDRRDPLNVGGKFASRNGAGSAE